MISREFDAIAKADIDALVSNAVAEGRLIEYKQQLPGNSDEDKREFLADVSSFANAGGGDIICGVVEKRDSNGKPTGIPEKAEGLAGLNADAEIRRLDEIVRAGLDPRAPGIRIRAVDGFTAGPALVIRIPKSWASPHMVIFKNVTRFYSRTSAGKYQLDVGEIRSAFIASGDVRNRISAFRTERLGKIIANEGPVSLPETPKIILHLVPLTIVDHTVQVDLTPLRHDPNPGAPIQNYSYNTRNNLDGYLSYNMPRSEAAYGAGYTQVFRSGALEAVDAELSNDSNYPKVIASTYVEEKIIEATTRFFNAAKRIGTPLPLVVMMTATDLKGYALATGPSGITRHKIDRNILLFPDVLLESYDTPTDVVLKPIFDALWQSAGFASCQHYSKDGRWTSS